MIIVACPAHNWQALLSDTYHGQNLTKPEHAGALDASLQPARYLQPETGHQES